MTTVRCPLHVGNRVRNFDWQTLICCTDAARSRLSGLRPRDLSFRRVARKTGDTEPQSPLGRHGIRQGCYYNNGIGIRAMKSDGQEQSNADKANVKTCVRCGVNYRDEDNSPVVCKYHGHMTGDMGFYALAPPHQGIDGEWSEASGVIVYKWNDDNERPNTGSKNWKRRWTCCGVYDEDAPPCHSRRHVSYDDGATRF